VELYIHSPIRLHAVVLHKLSAGTAFLALKKINSVALARKRTILTERPHHVGEVSANLCGYRVFLLLICTAQL
jgi:hypothetical protein